MRSSSWAPYSGLRCFNLNVLEATVAIAHPTGPEPVPSEEDVVWEGELIVVFVHPEHGELVEGIVPEVEVFEGAPAHREWL